VLFFVLILHTAFLSFVLFTIYKVSGEGEVNLKREDDLGGGLVDCVLLMTLPSLESSGVLGGGCWKSSQNCVKNTPQHRDIPCTYRFIFHSITPTIIFFEVFIRILV
jgi:hypothetical protein